MKRPDTIYLGQDDWGNEIFLVCIFNPVDPDASEWFVHTKWNY